MRFGYVPDWSSALDENPRVRSVKFGDGYEQRVVDGVNTILQKWSVAFENRSKSDIEDIRSFLRGHKGVSSFEFEVPDESWEVVDHEFGEGDGARTQFQLTRPGYEAVDDDGEVPATHWLTTPVIKKDGVTQTEVTHYTLDSSGLVTFLSPPALGESLTFTSDGEVVKNVVCKKWRFTPVDSNNYSLSAEFEEVME